jgi:hypothetical protein
MAGEQAVSARRRHVVVSASHRFGFFNLIGGVDKQALISGHGRTRFLARHRLARWRWWGKFLRSSTPTTRRFGDGVESIRTSDQPRDKPAVTPDQWAPARR